MAVYRLRPGQKARTSLFELLKIFLDIVTPHRPAHDTGSGGAGSFDFFDVFTVDAADGVNRQGNAVDDFFEKINSPSGQSFFAVGGKDMPCGNVGTAQRRGLDGVLKAVAGRADPL